MRAVVSGSGLEVVVVTVGLAREIVTEDVDHGLGPETENGLYCCCL